ncbi:hypothetical protein Tco_1504171 [Tanacetum coccineum]
MVKTGLVEAIDSLVPLDEHFATFQVWGILETDIQEKEQKESQKQTNPSTGWKGQSQKSSQMKKLQLEGLKLPNLKLYYKRYQRGWFCESTHKKVDQVFHEIVPQLAERAKDDLIENNLKPSIATTIIEDRDTFRSEVDRVLHEIVPQLAEKATDDLIENNLKPSIAATILTNLMPKHQRSSKNFSRITYKAIHDDHQEDDAPPEGEKRVKRHKASKSSKSARETVIDDDEVILKDETHELITELQNVDKHVPTIFDRARMEATLNDMLSNQFKNAEEYAYHLEQATSFMENQMVWESEQVDIRRLVPRPLVFCGPQWSPNKPPRIATNQPHDLDFMEQIIVMRENDKPDSFSEADFKYLNKNDIEDLYYLCRNKKFNYQPWRKPPLLGELDCDILRALEREITKRLRHRKQMRKWESFVNGRPILSIRRSKHLRQPIQGLVRKAKHQAKELGQRSAARAMGTSHNDQNQQRRHPILLNLWHGSCNSSRDRDALTKHEASQAKEGEKLSPKWEGPYEVVEALEKGAYKIRNKGRDKLPRT